MSISDGSTLAAKILSTGEDGVVMSALSKIKKCNDDKGARDTAIAAQQALMSFARDPDMNSVGKDKGTRDHGFLCVRGSLRESP